MAGIRYRFIREFLNGKHGFPIVLGIIVGLTVNLVTVPFFEQACTEGDPTAEALVTIDNGQQPLPDEDFEPRVVTRDPEEIAQKVR